MLVAAFRPVEPGLARYFLALLVARHSGMLQYRYITGTSQCRAVLKVNSMIYVPCAQEALESIEYTTLFPAAAFAQVQSCTLYYCSYLRMIR